MYAIVQVGSSQFKVSEGDVIDAHRIKLEEGKEVVLDKVLMFAKDSDVRIGQPYLKDVEVTAKVVRQHLDAKVIAFKYRRRKDSSSKIGHRQKLTALSITQIKA
ncbi:LSU ribosomal protein L21p [hydrothermal vent metagenome]|uniref:LSU ribosomal protein L21p n=1 Tax=hydrothermal vent metagenome TaxID=652676 RepID=A0A3B1DNQ5_9ZZZZ